jgi:hypothetical protein
MAFKSAVMLAVTTIFSAASAFAGDIALPPDPVVDNSGGNEAALLVFLVIGAVLLAANSGKMGKTKPDPEATDE